MIGLTLGDISKKLSEEVIEEFFRLKTNSKDVVKRIEVSRASAPGEGLLSAVYRVKVTGGRYTASFVVKGLVASPLLQRTLDCKKYFKREVDFFTRILPVLCEVQISLGAKERISNQIPTCYGCHHDGDNDYILLEDLSESQCRTVSVHPSDEEKNNVLQVLAHFHAVSMALRLDKPEIFDEIADFLPELYFNEKNRDWYSTYLQNAVEADRQVMMEIEDPDSIYLKKFNEVLSKDLYGQYISSVSNRGEHPVLCHGDSWAPNFLHSNQRMVIIDFQIVRCASPATDLAYWLMLCCNRNTTARDFLNAVDTYYRSMEYYLKDMGFEASEVFPRAALDKEFQLFGKNGFLACLTSFPLMTADKFDYSVSLEETFPGLDKVPLECLWSINPIEDEKQKLSFRNAVRVAVDVGLI